MAPKYISRIKNQHYAPPALDKTFANILGDDVHLSQFYLIGVIGVGRFGEISLVQHPNGFETYALKKIRKNRIADSHSALDSDFCVQLSVYLLWELFDLLNFNKRFPE
eukprot:359989_1